MTKKELEVRTKDLFTKATLAEYKWMYSYLSNLEEWPIITDEVKLQKDPDLVSGEAAWEKCPFDWRFIY